MAHLARTWACVEPTSRVGYDHILVELGSGSITSPRWALRTGHHSDVNECACLQRPMTHDWLGERDPTQANGEKPHEQKIIIDGESIR